MYVWVCTCVEAWCWHQCLSQSLSTSLVESGSLAEPGAHWFQKSSYPACPRGFWALSLEYWDYSWDIVPAGHLILVLGIKISISIFTDFHLVVISPGSVFLGLLELTNTLLFNNLNRKTESGELPWMNKVSPESCFWLFSFREVVLLWSPKAFLTMQPMFTCLVV